MSGIAMRGGGGGGATRARFVGVVVGIAATTASAPARADLRDVSARVSDVWRGAGGDVREGASRFVHDDETITIALPDGPSAKCTSVALIGARGLSFRARLAITDDDGTDDAHASGVSVAGALFLSHCGGQVLDRVVLTSEAGRGAIETVVGRGQAQLPVLVTVLPERAGGHAPTQHLVEPGELPPLVPAALRADAAELRARREGAAIASRITLPAGTDGSGLSSIELEAGCHRVELFGVDPRGKGAAPAARQGPGRATRERRRLDIDAELRDGDDELLARDRTEAADARLDACVGDATSAQAVFIGSPPAAQVVITHARWAIPERLPSAWGSDARARMASALLTRHAPPPTTDALFLAQGPSGATMVPMAVEPGACYLAVAAITHGSARGLGLRAVVGSREIADERGVGGVASAVAFCAQERDAVRLGIDARGTALAWALAVFRIQGAVWGSVR